MSKAIQVKSARTGIRGVLAAYATGGSFCVLCDARRPDLIEDWYSVMRAVKSCVLRCRLQLLTWQELTTVLSRSLRKFLAEKYGITCCADDDHREPHFGCFQTEPGDIHRPAAADS
jgi:hypothetical protein